MLAQSTSKAPSKRTMGKRKPRGQGSYVPACDRCKDKKLKCSLDRPACAPCTKAGHECTWDGTPPTKRAVTLRDLAFVETRKDALQSMVGLLSAELEKYKQKYGEILEDESSPSAASQSCGGSGSSGDDSEPGEEAIGKVETDDEDLLWQRVSRKRENLIYDRCHLFFYGRGTEFELASARGRILAPPSSRFVDMESEVENSYILLSAPGVPNADFDFSRYLPKTTMDRFSHDHILDLFFKFFMSWGFRIVPALFLRDMGSILSAPRSSTPRRTAHYSPMLHNILIGVGAAWSDKAECRSLEFRAKFIEEAKKHLDSECQKPSVSAVNALSTLASYYSSQGEQTLGYMYFGMCARLVHALGLAIDCSPWVKANIITTDDMRDRNWCYWAIFAQDVFWSLYVGRETSVPLPSKTAPIPFPYIDAEFDQEPWVYPAARMKMDPQPNYESRTFVELCYLLLIARGIIELVHPTREQRPDVENASITDYDEQLRNWMDRLPPEIQMKPSALPHVIMLHMTHKFLTILLHRPHYRVKRQAACSQSRILQHFQICDDAAKKLVALAKTYRSLYSVLHTPITFVQSVFCAGTVFVLATLRSHSGPRRSNVLFNESVASTELCIELLEETGQRWQCAKNEAEILKNLLSRQVARGAVLGEGTKTVHGARPSFALTDYGGQAGGTAADGNGVSKETVAVSSVFPPVGNVVSESHSGRQTDGSPVDLSTAFYTTNDSPSSASASFLPSSSSSSSPMFADFHHAVDPAPSILGSSAYPDPQDGFLPQQPSEQYSDFTSLVNTFDGNSAWKNFEMFGMGLPVPHSYDLSERLGAGAASAFFCDTEMLTVRMGNGTDGTHWGGFSPFSVVAGQGLSGYADHGIAESSSMRVDGGGMHGMDGLVDSVDVGNPFVGSLVSSGFGAGRDRRG